ncbi:hypothetical protein [Gimesia aquarii]|uniref:Outer membrane efflux protein n=1 Tax=Gimesia aquarii TaxID=2527964 RepID=A0A517VP77_9PLAN|nr:hypothetical protein [Gimesia aquarii]QDT94817.1 hypothetical protein V144x_02490 [Gimesia aquarii]
MQMLIKNVLLILIVAVLITTSLDATQQKPENKGTSIQQLMKEREQILQKLVDIVKEKYNQGNSSLNLVFAAERELLDAQLASATNLRQRIVIRELQLRLAKDHEQHVVQRIKQGFDSREDLMRAIANRLIAEIELLREKKQA